jgi:hypothetical protein
MDIFRFKGKYYDKNRNWEGKDREISGSELQELVNWCVLHIKKTDESYTELAHRGSPAMLMIPRDFILTAHFADYYSGIDIYSMNSSAIEGLFDEINKNYPELIKLRATGEFFSELIRKSNEPEMPIHLRTGESQTPYLCSRLSYSIIPWSNQRNDSAPLHIKIEGDVGDWFGFDTSNADFEITGRTGRNCFIWNSGCQVYVNGCGENFGSNSRSSHLRVDYSGEQFGYSSVQSKLEVCKEVRGKIGSRLDDCQLVFRCEFPLKYLPEQAKSCNFHFKGGIKINNRNLKNFSITDSQFFTYDSETYKLLKQNLGELDNPKGNCISLVGRL